MDGAQVRFCFVVAIKVDSFAASYGLPSPGPVSFIQSLHTSHLHPPSSVLGQTILSPTTLLASLLGYCISYLQHSMAPSHSTGKWYLLTHLVY